MKPLPKVLVVNTTYRNLGGEDTNIIDELNLLKQKYEVSYLEFNNSKNINIFDIISFFLSSNYLSNKIFRKKLDEFKPDFIYIHNTWFKASLGIFKIIRKNNLNALVKIHSFRYECGRYFYINNHLKNEQFCKACGLKQKKLKVLNKYFNNSYAKSLFLILYSKKYYKILKNEKIKILTITSFHKEKIIENGIDSSKVFLFSNPIQNSNIIEKSFSDNSVIYAGRITEMKGIESLLECWSKLRNNKTKLKVIGSGDLKEKLISKYKNSINIEFIGEIPNNKVLNIISSCKAVILPTRVYEGQPRLLCEASNMGKVSIYPSFGGMNEFFPNGYEYKFNQYNYEDLLDKIEMLLSDNSLEKKGLENKKFLDQKLDSEKLLNQFEEILETI